MRVPVWCAVAAMMSVSPLLSQAPGGAEPAPTRADVSIGAAFTGSNPAEATVGFGGSVGVHPWSWFGVSGEFEVFSGTAGVANSTFLSDYLVGPKFFLPLRPRQRVSPFADVLFGGQTMHNGSTQHTYYYSNGTGMALAVDGGIDLRINRRLALRAQAGSLYSRFPVSAGSSVGNNRWRSGVSLVYRF